MATCPECRHEAGYVANTFKQDRFTPAYRATCVRCGARLQVTFGSSVTVVVGFLILLGLLFGSPPLDAFFQGHPWRGLAAFLALGAAWHYAAWKLVVRLEKKG